MSENNIFNGLEGEALEKAKNYLAEKELQQGERKKVEACKICDNNCAYCQYDCNCSTLIDVDEIKPTRIERGLKSGILKKVPVI